MKASFVISALLGAAAVNAGVLKTRATNGQSVVYWGQNDNEKGLGTYCAANQGIDIIVLAFLYKFGNGNTPQGNFGTECTVTSSGAGQNCGSLKADIDTCKKAGKKIFISIGGASTDYKITGNADADGIAWSLWNEWAAPAAVDSSAPRPIGSSFVDGWDFDIESNPSNSGNYLGEVITKLRSYFPTDSSHTYYISGAPQCPLPEANMGTAITNSQFDYLFIQFYNNDYCSAFQLYNNDGGEGDHFNYDDWVTFIGKGKSKSAKLFVGLPASKTASTDDNTGAKYYITPANLVKLVKTYKTRAAWGGVMLWDASYSDANVNNKCTYAQEVYNILNKGTAC